jgi:crossover junction endodeoxyribonuclease RusA
VTAPATISDRRAGRSGAGEEVGASASAATSYSFDLPFPSPDLSPNARLHWAAKAKAVRIARKQAWALTLAAGAKSLPWRGVHLVMTFCPPDRRHYDRDNLIARMKAAQDGIADAIGIDDARFVASYAIGGIIKGGCVRVAISEIMNSEG